MSLCKVSSPVDLCCAAVCGRGATNGARSIGGVHAGRNSLVYQVAKQATLLDRTVIAPSTPVCTGAVPVPTSPRGTAMQ
jgi:hypothetical protein